MPISLWNVQMTRSIARQYMARYCFLPREILLTMGLLWNGSLCWLGECGISERSLLQHNRIQKFWRLNLLSMECPFKLRLGGAAEIMESAVRMRIRLGFELYPDILDLISHPTEMTEPESNPGRSESKPGIILKLEGYPCDMFAKLLDAINTPAKVGWSLGTASICFQGIYLAVRDREELREVSHVTQELAQCLIDSWVAQERLPRLQHRFMWVADCCG
jgi:hypothetical protein